MKTNTSLQNFEVRRIDFKTAKFLTAIELKIQIERQPRGKFLAKGAFPISKRALSSSKSVCPFRNQPWNLEIKKYLCIFKIFFIFS